MGCPISCPSSWLTGWNSAPPPAAAKEDDVASGLVPPLDAEPEPATVLPAAVEREGIGVLLAAEKLENYGKAMLEAGYSFVTDLLDADDDEITKLMEDVHMKKPEARRFHKEIAARKIRTAQIRVKHETKNQEL